MSRTKCTKTSKDISLEIATFDLVSHVVTSEEKGQRKVRERRKGLKNSPKLLECQGFYFCIWVCSIFVEKQMLYLNEFVLINNTTVKLS